MQGTIQTARGGPDAPSLGRAVLNVAGEGALQGGAEAVGAGLVAAGRPIARGLMQSALKPEIRQGAKALIRGESAPPVVETLLKEGVSVSKRGIEKLSAATPGRQAHARQLLPDDVPADAGNRVGVEGPDR